MNLPDPISPASLIRFASGLLIAAAPLFVQAEAWVWQDPPATADASLILLGDFNVQQRQDPGAALVHVRDTLAGVDLVYANLEGLLVESQGPAHDLPNKTGWTHLGPGSVAALIAGNIGVVGAANNVAFGRENILRSLTVLDEHGILHTGAGRDIEAAHQPAIIEKRGVRFGFLQYTSKWYDQSQQIATGAEPGVARLMSPDGESLDPGDRKRLLEDIAALRSRVDILVVSTHTRDGQGRDGVASARAPNPARDEIAELTARLPVNEGLQYAEPYQRLLAKTAIDAGADIVFGHGCHMLQAVEVYRGKPVLHCLGDFASDWIRVRDYRYGLLARVLANRAGLSRVSVVPVTRDQDENNVMLLDPGVEEGAELYRKLVELSPDTPLKIRGREIVLLGD